MVSHPNINERFNDMILTFQFPHLIQFLDSAFLSFLRSTSITNIRQSSFCLKKESKLCPRIRIFPSFVSQERLEIISFPAFPAFLYLSQTFLAFPENPSLSIPSYPSFPSCTYKNFNIFKNLKVRKLGIPGNSHFTQLFSSFSCKSCSFFNS